MTVTEIKDFICAVYRRLKVGKTEMYWKDVVKFIIDNKNSERATQEVLDRCEMILNRK